MWNGFFLHNQVGEWLLHILTDYSLRIIYIQKLYNMYFKSLWECTVIIATEMTKMETAQFAS